jgi:hypothetical protein
MTVAQPPSDVRRGERAGGAAHEYVCQSRAITVRQPA